MAILACGLNHRTASVAIREKIYFPREELASSLQDLASQQTIQEAAILTTCNRTEVYCASEHAGELLQWLQQRFPHSRNELSKCLYLHQEEAAVRHILRVACGLDSLVVGESEIQGQLKTAFAAANEAGTIGPKLQRLFQLILSVTKGIRTQTGVGSKPVSVAYTAVNLATRIFADFSNITALLIGAGETMELAGRYLSNKQIGNLVVCNRTYSRALNLAQKIHGQALPWTELLNFLPNVDILFTATNASLPILGKGAVERALRLRKHKPIYMVDLAIPRNIEPQVAELSDVYLYSIDDLQKLIESNLTSRSKAAEDAEILVNLQASYFMDWLKSLTSVNLIRAYRNNVEKIRDKEVTKALHLLKLGHKAEEVILSLGRSLSNKIMHQPTTAIRHADVNGELEFLHQARKLLVLEE